MVEPLRHRQTKEAATDMFSLKTPRHIPTLPKREILAASRCFPLFTRLCCKSLFVSPITNFPGCRRGDRMLMWGTASFYDELPGDFGGAFEATSIDGCHLFCRLAEI